MTILLRLIVLFLLLGGLLGVCLGGRPGRIDPSIIGNPTTLISRVVELSELVTPDYVYIVVHYPGIPS